MSPRWKKVLRDLLAHKVRTILVALSIAVGIFAVAIMLGGREVLLRALDTSFPQTNPPGVTIYARPFDELVVRAVERHAGVTMAEGRHMANLTFRVNGKGDWQNITLEAVKDYDHIKVGKLDRQPNTNWPARGQVLVEEGSRTFVGAKPGDMLEIQTSGKHTAKLLVVGYVHDLNALTPLMSIRGVGFINFDSLQDLQEAPYFNELDVAVSPKLTTQAEVSKLGAQLRDDVLAQRGISVMQMVAHKPGKQLLGDIFGGVSLLLVSIGVLTLFLSGFLVVNTVSALVAQQLRHIGVMKAVGGRPRQLVAMYFVMVALYGAVAVAIAIPLGMWGQQAFVDFGATKLNFLVRDHSTPPNVLAIELAVGFLVPLLAAAVPVLTGMRISVRQALYDADNMASAEFGHGLVDRLLGRLRGLPRPIALSLRNTFLRKGRLALTLITLTLAAGVFMAVASVQTSIDATVARIGQHRPFDLWVNLAADDPQAMVEREVKKVSGVTGAESWLQLSATRERPDGSESGTMYFTGLPADSTFYKPELVQGRWLKPGDTDVAVVDTGVRNDEPDVHVGGTITMKMGDLKQTWKVVGLVRGDFTNGAVRVNLPYLQKIAAEKGAANMEVVRGAQHDGASAKALADTIKSHLENKGLKVAETETEQHLMSSIAGSLSILVVFLVILAGLLAAVGGIGLSGTMSINVMESTREIGVMRAIGASNRSLYQVFITEGIVVGLLSWALGAAIAAPIAWALTRMLTTAISFPLTFAFSPAGVVAWLVFVIVLSVLASLLPAYRAARVSVAEAIAYE